MIQQIRNQVYGDIYVCSLIPMRFLGISTHIGDGHRSPFGDFSAQNLVGFPGWDDINRWDSRVFRKHRKNRDLPSGKLT
jgi:hypothetical protein